MANTDRRLNSQVPIHELEHLLPVSDLELEAIASMPIEDVDLELRQLGLDPNEPLPHRIACLMSESVEPSEPCNSEDAEADDVPAGILVNKKYPSIGYSAALGYCLDNYLSLLEKCRRVMRVRSFLSYESDGEDLAQIVCERFALIPDRTWWEIEKREHYLLTIIRHEADRAYRRKKDSPVTNLEDPALHARPHFDLFEAALEPEDTLKIRTWILSALSRVPAIWALALLAVAGIMIGVALGVGHLTMPIFDRIVWMNSPSGYVLVTLLVVWLLAPSVWLFIERSWWRLALGNSTASQLLRRDALNDFKLSIEQRAIDSSLPHHVAALLAVFVRPFELKRMTRDLMGLKRDICGEIFESAITQLNAAWRNGRPPQILKGYIKIIEESAGDSTIDPVLRLRGKSAVAVVKYALGDLRESHDLGVRNWAEAQRLESDEESELKWIASYGYFNSILFLGDFKRAMKLMTDQWSRYFAPLDCHEKEALKKRLSGQLILNPILAVPRHIILAAAFNEQPCFEPAYWPSQAVFDKLAPEERERELRWAEAWYEEAKRLCTSEPTSLSFSHAYSGFYFTLLLLESGMPKAYLHEKINQAFDAIDDSSPIVARYVKYGFWGVYNLVCGEDEKALECLSRAATFSALSGNRFADCIFMCCHAVAAARLNRPSRYLMPDVSYYLTEAERLARKINRPFYKKLCYGAKAAIYQLRGEKTKAQRYAAWSKQGGTQNRILKIFYKDGQERGRVNETRFSSSPSQF
jgi:hypothetical protein